MRICFPLESLSFAWNNILQQEKNPKPGLDFSLPLPNPCVVQQQNGRSKNPFQCNEKCGVAPAVSQKQVAQVPRQLREIEKEETSATGMWSAAIYCPGHSWAMYMGNRRRNVCYSASKGCRRDISKQNASKEWIRHQHNVIPPSIHYKFL